MIILSRARARWTAVKSVPLAGFSERLSEYSAASVIHISIEGE